MRNVILMLLLASGAGAQGLPAFPSLTGGGAASVGGRGGIVMRVTNLNDSGTGSLRWCLSASSERTCVFDVAGTIKNASRLSINNPYVTIACQTAPGGGIVLGGQGSSGETIQIATHDVILTYCTYDGNNGSATGPDTGSVGLEGGNGPASNVVVAYNTLYRWGNKVLFTASNDQGNASKFSFYRNWAFTPSAKHPVLAEPDNWGNGSAIATTQIDYIQNLFAFLDHRCILWNVGSMSMVNNKCYDTLQLSSSFDTNFWNGLQARIEGNIYEDGPDSHNKVRVIIGQYPETGNDPSDCYPHCNNAHITPQLQLTDNIGHANDDTGGKPIACCSHVPNDAGQVSMTYQGSEAGQDPRPGIVIAPMPSSWFSAKDPTPKEQFPIVALADPLSFDTNVAPFVGNYQGLNCDGTWRPRRNSLDQQAWNTYMARGSMPMFSGSGASPVIAPGTPCGFDSKNNLPIAYEQKWNITAGMPSNVPTETNYTELENYIWGIRNSAPPPVNPFPPGSSVKTTSQVNVRATPGGTLVGTQAAGAIATVGAATPVTQNGTTWYPLTFANPPNGWVGGDQLVSTTPPPPVHPTVSCPPATVLINATLQCTADQSVTWSVSAGTITAAGLFTAPATAQTVTITGTNANGSGATPITVTAPPPPNTFKLDCVVAPDGSIACKGIM